MAGVLPPWHDRCQGSRVWCDFLLVGLNRPLLDNKGLSPLTSRRARLARGCSWDMPVGWVLPPLGDRPRGSPVWQGVTPCTPNRAKRRGATLGACGLAGFYRRSATGLAARGFGRVPCIHRAQIAVAPAVPRLAPVFGKTPEPVRGKPAPRHPRWEQKPSLFDASKPPSRKNYFNPQGVSLPTANCVGAERR